ncbi:unnamed protein product, partial [marine sediment metagenome]
IMKKTDMETKLESLVAEINKIKNAFISEGREATDAETAEIEELRNHIRNLEEIRESFLIEKKE